MTGQEIVRVPSSSTVPGGQFGSIVYPAVDPRGGIPTEKYIRSKESKYIATGAKQTRLFISRSVTLTHSIGVIILYLQGQFDPSEKGILNPEPIKWDLVWTTASRKDEKPNVAWTRSGDLQSISFLAWGKCAYGRNAQRHLHLVEFITDMYGSRILIL